MKLLLDTHAFLWYISDDPKLPRYAYDAIRDKSNEVYLSVVSPLGGPRQAQERQAAFATERR
jgi:PIN domain nuclease of toxin-antitoxin system